MSFDCFHILLMPSDTAFMINYGIFAKKKERIINKIVLKWKKSIFDSIALYWKYTKIRKWTKMAKNYKLWNKFMIKCLELSDSEQVNPKHLKCWNTFNDFQKCARDEEEEEWLAWQVDNEPGKKENKFRCLLCHVCIELADHHCPIWWDKKRFLKRTFNSTNNIFVEEGPLSQFIKH